MRSGNAVKHLTPFVLALFLLTAVVTAAFSEEVADSRKDLLMKRVTKFYEDKISGGMDKNYDYYDPFFRTRVTRKGYEGSLIEAKYHSYKIGDVTITENIAKVPVEIVFEIPESLLMGKKIVVPPRQDRWVDDWIWIDNNWYKAFKLNMNRTYIPFFPSWPQ